MNNFLDLYSFLAVNITVSDMALEVTNVRLFPESRHRSKRIHKKLMKRFGGEFRKVPCIFRTPTGLIAHPAMYEKLKQHLSLQPLTEIEPHP